MSEEEQEQEQPEGAQPKPGGGAGKKKRQWQKVDTAPFYEQWLQETPGSTPSKGSRFGKGKNKGERSFEGDPYIPRGRGAGKGCGGVEQSQPPVEDEAVKDPAAQSPGGFGKYGGQKGKRSGGGGKGRDGGGCGKGGGGKGAGEGSSGGGCSSPCGGYLGGKGPNIGGARGSPSGKGKSRGFQDGGMMGPLADMPGGACGSGCLQGPAGPCGPGGCSGGPGGGPGGSPGGGLVGSLGGGGGGFGGCLGNGLGGDPSFGGPRSPGPQRPMTTPGSPKGMQQVVYAPQPGMQGGMFYLPYMIVQPGMPAAGVCPIQSMPPMSQADRQGIQNQVQQQIEWWFGQHNLSNDFHLRDLMNEEGWVPLERIARFPRLVALTTELSIIREAVSASSYLELNPDGTLLRIRPGPSSQLNSSSQGPP